MTTATRGRKEGKKGLVTKRPEKTSIKTRQLTPYRYVLKGFPFFSVSLYISSALVCMVKKCWQILLWPFPKKEGGPSFQVQFSARTRLCNEKHNFFKNPTQF